jgi:hypothetical protein
VGGKLENGFVASLPLDAAQELGPECAIPPMSYKVNSQKLNFRFTEF